MLLLAPKPFFLQSAGVGMKGKVITVWNAQQEPIVDIVMVQYLAILAQMEPSQLFHVGNVVSTVIPITKYTGMFLFSSIFLHVLENKHIPQML